MRTMTWTETHRRWQALHAIEQQLAVALHPELPWNDELALLFGDPDGLRAALRHQWWLAVSTQLDTHLPESALEEQRRRLKARFRGVRAVLDLPRHLPGVPALDMPHDDGLGTTHAVA